MWLMWCVKIVLLAVDVYKTCCIAAVSDQAIKDLGHASSTQTLRDLEISLRTNHIEWVICFIFDVFGCGLKNTV